MTVRCPNAMRGAAGLLMPIFLGASMLGVCATADCGSAAARHVARPVPKQRAARLEPPPPIDLSGFAERAIVIEGVGAPGLRDRRVVIVRPRGYDSSRRYPSLFVNDGEAVGASAFDIVGALDRLVDRGEVEPHVVIAIESTGSRQAEYTFVPPSYAAIDEQWADPAALRPEARTSDQRYVDFLAQVVAPLAEQHANIDPARERTAILGFSFGGLSALHAAMRWPERFGRVVCESASLWWADGATISAFRRYRGPLPERLWVDAGTMEGFAGEAVPYMVRYARDLAKAAVERGMELGDELGYYEAPLGEHTDFWVAARIEPVLAFALTDVRVDPRRDVRKINFWVFAPVLTHDQSTSYSVELSFDSILRMSALPWETTLRVQEPAVVRVEDGLLHGRTLMAGTSTVTARYGRIEYPARVTVRE